MKHTKSHRRKRGFPRNADDRSCRLHKIPILINGARLSRGYRLSVQPAFGADSENAIVRAKVGERRNLGEVRKYPELVPEQSSPGSSSTDLLSSPGLLPISTSCQTQAPLLPLRPHRPSTLAARSSALSSRFALPRSLFRFLPSSLRLFLPRKLPSRRSILAERPRAASILTPPALRIYFGPMP